MDSRAIAAYCDIGERSVRRILAHFDQHDDVRHPKPTKRLVKDRNGLHKLADYEVEVR
jgi:hypothetical protein